MAESHRYYWDYEGGGLADFGQHKFDGPQYAYAKDHTSPVEVEAFAPPQHPEATERQPAQLQRTERNAFQLQHLVTHPRQQSPDLTVPPLIHLNLEVCALPLCFEATRALHPQSPFGEIQPATQFVLRSRADFCAARSLPASASRLATGEPHGVAEQRG